MTLSEALHDASWRLDEWGQEPVETLEDAVSILKRLIGAECECDFSHRANGPECCLCEYHAVLANQNTTDDGKE